MKNDLGSGQSMGTASCLAWGGLGQDDGRKDSGETEMGSSQVAGPGAGGNY